MPYFCADSKMIRDIPKSLFLGEVRRYSTNKTGWFLHLESWILEQTQRSLHGTWWECRFWPCNKARDKQAEVKKTSVMLLWVFSTKSGACSWRGIQTWGFPTDMPYQRVWSLHFLCPWSHGVGRTWWGSSLTLEQQGSRPYFSNRSSTSSSSDSCLFLASKLNKVMQACNQSHCHIVTLSDHLQILHNASLSRKDDERWIEVTSEPSCWVWFSLNLSSKSGLQDYHHEPIFRSWSHPALCDIFLLQKVCCSGRLSELEVVGLANQKYRLRTLDWVSHWDQSWEPFHENVCLSGLEEFVYIVTFSSSGKSSLLCLLVAIVHAPHLRITILASLPNPLAMSFRFWITAPVIRLLQISSGLVRRWCSSPANQTSLQMPRRFQ